MSNIELNNEVVVAIEQWEDGKILDRREAVHYFGLPNALANQLNLLFSEGVDAGILAEIEALMGQKAALTGQTEILGVLEPLVQSRREERGKEVKARKEGKTPPGQAK